MSALVFRDLSGMAELRKAEALQRDVWGEGDLPDPADLMMVIQAEGGLVGGAFEGDRLLGYIFGFPTREAGVQHSHRLAVHPDARGRHLGLGLKRYQRDWCLARGIHHVRWTFDPLRAPNAALNIHRLGAESSTYFADYYGEMEGINRGIASDRLLVDWRLNSPTVSINKKAVAPTGEPRRKTIRFPCVGMTQQVPRVIPPHGNSQPSASRTPLATKQCAKPSRKSCPVKRALARALQQQPRQPPSRERSISGPSPFSCTSCFSWFDS